MLPGFDSVTGGLKDIKFRGDKNERTPTLAEYWEHGAWTYLGMSVHGYPNMFFTYGKRRNLGGSGFLTD